jgi:hypothetical protein
MASYKCHICDKLFKRKYDLKRHKLKKNKCAKNAQSFNCSKCDKIYSTMGSLTRHLTQYCKGLTLHPQKPSNTTQKFNIIPQKSSKILKNNPNVKSFCTQTQHDSINTTTHICNYCDKEYTRLDNLKRHVNERCKVKKNITQEREQIFQKLLKIVEQNNELKCENDHLKSKKNDSIGTTINNITNTNNITNNNTKNINNNNNNTTNINIQLVVYGKEDRNLLKNTDIFNILCKGFKSVPELVKAINFNEDLFENHKQKLVF